MKDRVKDEARQKIDPSFENEEMETRANSNKYLYGIILVIALFLLYFIFS